MASSVERTIRAVNTRLIAENARLRLQLRHLAIKVDGATDKQLLLLNQVISLQEKLDAISNG